LKKIVKLPPSWDKILGTSGTISFYFSFFYLAFLATIASLSAIFNFNSSNYSSFKTYRFKIDSNDSIFDILFCASPK